MALNRSIVCGLGKAVHCTAGISQIIFQLLIMLVVAAKLYATLRV